MTKKLLLLLLVIFIVIDVFLFFNYFSPIRNLNFSIGRTKPGSCLILEEKYCNKVVFIRNPLDQSSLLAAYKLPKGTALFSPINGYYTSGATFFFSNDPQAPKYLGVNIYSSADGSPEKSKYMYSFVFENEIRNPDGSINKGSFFGSLSDTKINFLGDYNLAVQIGKKGDEKSKFLYNSDNNLLQQILGKKL